MKLDVIVPHWQENEKQIMCALSMINNQIAHSFDVLITVVTDLGGVALDEDAIQKVSKYPIKFITTDKHLFAGYSRQYAMDRTDGEYIIFCDSDDQFASPFVFKYFEDVLKENGKLDVIYTAYLEEMNTPEGLVYQQKDDDVSITCLHGKMYNREFLYKHNIRFPNLRISEDGAFNFQCVCHAKNVVFNDDVVTYIWKFNPKSLTRDGTELVDYSVNIRSFRQSIDGFEYFFEETKKESSLVNTKVISRFIDSLYTQLGMLEPLKSLSSVIAEELEGTRERLDKCRAKYKEYFND